LFLAFPSEVKVVTSKRYRKFTQDLPPNESNPVKEFNHQTIIGT